MCGFIWNSKLKWVFRLAFHMEVFFTLCSCTFFSSTSQRSPNISEGFICCCHCIKVCSDTNLYDSVWCLVYFCQKRTERGCRTHWIWSVCVNFCATYYETDRYFLQNFQCTTLLIYAFCKMCEHKCYKNQNKTISGSHLGSQIL